MLKSCNHWSREHRWPLVKVKRTKVHRKKEVFSIGKHKKRSSENSWVCVKSKGTACEEFRSNLFFPSHTLPGLCKAFLSLAASLPSKAMLPMLCIFSSTRCRGMGSKQGLQEYLKGQRQIHFLGSETAVRQGSVGFQVCHRIP